MSWKLAEDSGIVKVVFHDFFKLWSGETEAIKIIGFTIEKDGGKTLLNEMVGKDKFVPHPLEFYESVIQRIKEKI